ncbi:hypothetical protein [Thiocapsa bogorovii]|uniref:hypothetical protein n=1 Tax=Thiocapsa bogorovii TaxID=521689 RepID=UPI001E5DB2E8|nr:hypothetical protein [Thiocapsa bogorovii]UHD16894.1 hypothetical protein LT988_02175 [Thiocapsa bogorovii]
MSTRPRGRVGHLFQGRFKGILVEKESHLLELARYVVLNPVRAGMFATPKDWRWGSDRATAGLDAPAPFLTTDWLLRSFGEARAPAEAGYRGFGAAGINTPCPWDALKNQIFLGSEAFVARMQAMIDPDRALLEPPGSSAVRRRNRWLSVLRDIPSVIKRWRKPTETASTACKPSRTSSGSGG